MQNVKFELCIDSIVSLRSALGNHIIARFSDYPREGTPISRVELCSALFEGGLTPRSRSSARLINILC